LAEEQIEMATAHRAPTDMEPKASTPRGRYRITAPLGLGGMGVVFEAVDTVRHRTVALKFARAFRDDHAEGLRQLAHEAHAQALANNVRVCSIYDVTTHDGQPCLVMERLVGRTLEARLEDGRIDNDELISMALQLTEALAAVHRAGLVHQDIKPANLFVTRFGSIKLLDFGLARRAGSAPGDSGSKKRSARPAVLGTTNYIAPERILRRPADPRSDLFSLGAVIYEMATGRPPFAGASPAATIFNVLDSQPPSIRAAAPGRPIALDRLVRKLLAKPADRRYQSAAAVRKALLRIRAGRLPSLAPTAISQSIFMRGVHHVPNHDRRARLQ
jgi:serine/threonine protein kinase